MINKAEAQQRTKVYDDEEIQALHLLHLRYLSVTLSECTVLLFEPETAPAALFMWLRQILGPAVLVL